MKFLKKLKKKFFFLKRNLKHMQSSHSFFIAEEKFLINLDGLLKYLAEKIQIGLLCLYCDNKGTKGFKIGTAVQNHMVNLFNNFFLIKIKILINFKKKKKKKKIILI